MSKSRWFTLVELMVVIAIIAILAASLYPSMWNYFSRARDVQKINDINKFNNALLTYHTDKETFRISWAGWGIWNFWWMNFSWTYITTVYPKSIVTGLEELGYLGPWIKVLSDYTQNPVPTIATPQNPCINNVPLAPQSSKELYIFFFDDTTWKYSISWYLENPKLSDINSAISAYSYPSWFDHVCFNYGRNYAIWNN
jgi:prepilin-type N-terminal cleavage/methylation domain-containing protein